MKLINFSITEISGRTFEIPLDKAKEIIADIKKDKYFKDCKVNLDNTEEVVRFLYLYGLDNLHKYELSNDYYETQLVDMNESEV